MSPKDPKDRHEQVKKNEQIYRITKLLVNIKLGENVVQFSKSQTIGKFLSIFVVKNIYPHRI